MKKQEGAKGILAQLKGNPKLFLILPLLVIGVILILFGNWGEKKEDNRRALAGSNEMTLCEYSEMLERQITELCSTVEGVGNVSVAVSFASDFEYVYAQNKTEESGGKNQSNYLTVGNGASEGTVSLTRLPPKLSGVGIVCTGGGDIRVENELVCLISAAYGINSNRIYVAEAKK